MKPTDRTKILLLAIFLCTAIVSSAPAQTTGAGTITGTITDAQNLAVPGAAVSVRNTDTGSEHPLVTNEAGIYVATFLQPGNYEISASKVGFNKVTRKDLTLQVGQTLTVDLSLPVKSTATEVTVTGEALVVDPEKTEVSQVVSQAAVDNLPISGRRWDSFV